MDDETRELLGELLEAVAAILVSIEVDYAPRPSAGDQRHSLRRATSLLNRARDMLRATSTEPDAEARRIADAILRQYSEAGQPFGTSRAAMAQWLALGVDLGARQKPQKATRVGWCRFRHQRNARVEARAPLRLPRCVAGLQLEI